MSLPTRDNITTIDYSKDGSPWVNVTSKSGIDVDGLDWSKNGEPWWGLEVSLLPTENAVFFGINF